MKNWIQRWYLRLFKGRYYGRHRFDINTYLDLIPVGSLCFDVGANKGEKTKALLASGMRVVAFEPQPDCVSFIHQHCEGFSKELKVVQTAVGNETGSITLYQTDVPGHASVFEDWSSDETKNQIDVPMTTLREAIAAHGAPTYCKVDVEGFEVAVFEGLDQLIPYVSFEYHMNEKGLVKVMDCLEVLSRFGSLELNLISAERNQLIWPEWKSIDEFNKKFPDAFRGNRDFRYGDIFVRTLKK
ncbi:MAG: FkbM family methyltransferase [Verrucomicrobiota bacterium]